MPDGYAGPFARQGTFKRRYGFRTEMKSTDKIAEWFWDIFSSGLPRDYNLEILRKIFMLNCIITFAIIFLTLLGTLAFVQQNYILGSVDVIFASLLAGTLLFLRKKKKQKVVSAVTTVISGIFFLFLIAFGGVDNTAYVWLFTYPLVSIFLLGAGVGTVTSLTFLGMAVVVFVVGHHVALFASYSTNLILRIVPTYMTIYLFALVMEKTREIVQKRLETSRSELERSLGELEKSYQEKEKLLADLQASNREIRILQGILPICSHCKKIRDDDGNWLQFESYVRDHSDADFSHGLCPECRAQLYPEFSDGHKK